MYAIHFLIAIISFIAGLCLRKYWYRIKRRFVKPTAMQLAYENSTEPELLLYDWPLAINVPTEEQIEINRKKKAARLVIPRGKQ